MIFFGIAFAISILNEAGNAVPNIILSGLAVQVIKLRNQRGLIWNPITL
jgi:hypothetical protein